MLKVVSSSLVDIMRKRPSGNFPPGAFTLVLPLFRFTRL
jgi:hypothetical protein